MKTVCVLVLFCLITIATCQTRECTKASECNANECCMESSNGKRFLFDDVKGYCRALRKSGEQCDPFDATSRSNPNLRVIECPCEDGLTCHSTGSSANAHNSFCVHASN